MKTQAPHRAITPANPREEFLVRLLDSLWERYRGRVEYARGYEKVVADSGGTFLNDHVAFRTIASQDPAAGIFSISRVFEALDYRPTACYHFPDKHLAAVHFQHPNRAFPKIFISELRAWELSEPSRRAIAKALRSHRPALDDRLLARLRSPTRALEAPIFKFFSTLPWKLPEKRDVLALDRETQYGAWVLVNGYEVNHFTASIDAQGVDALADIEKTVAALRGAGIPMKPAIEGERGSKLRQSSTEAVAIPVRVMDRGRPTSITWPYAYFELAERPLVDGARFEGFLGGQAAQLFDMTKRRAG